MQSHACPEAPSASFRDEHPALLRPSVDEFRHEIRAEQARICSFIRESRLSIKPVDPLASRVRCNDEEAEYECSPFGRYL